MASVLAKYVKILMFPVNLCNSYPPPFFLGEYNYRLALYLVVDAALFDALLWSVRQKNKDIAFAISFFLLNLLPVSGIVPISIFMADRYLYLDYEAIGPDNRTLYTSDGARMTFRPLAADHSGWVKLDVLPGDKFWPEKVDSELATAAENLPSNLTIKGSIYHIEYKGDSPSGISLTIPIPKDAESHHTLDLYAWNGQVWEWQPSRRILVKNVIEAKLDFLPQAVAVMQTQALDLGLSSNYSHNLILAGDTELIGLEINLQGLALDSQGRITGQPDQIPLEIQNADLALIPIIRNWNEAGSSNPVDNLLLDPELRKQHIKAIVD